MTPRANRYRRREKENSRFSVLYCIRLFKTGKERFGMHQVNDFYGNPLNPDQKLSEAHKNGRE